MRFILEKLNPALRLTLVSVLVGWLVGVGAMFSPVWQTVEHRIFDLFSIVTAAKKSALPITIVGIDEASFTQLGARWPWPRDMHAQLVDRLTQAGAAVIAFDVLFPEPATENEDNAFAGAIATAGNVVLAADSGYHETAVSRQWLRMDPVVTFTKAGAATGLATMALDGDAVARRMAQADDAFWRESIRALIRSRPGSVEEPYVPPDAMIRYLGPTHTFPYVSYYQVLNGDPSIPADFFVDQIVLVGRDVRASPELGAAQADTFFTPFAMSTGLLTPGVELHATQIENALMGQTIQPVSRLLNVLTVSALLLLSTPLLYFWHPLRSTAFAILLAAMLGGFSTWLFAANNLWLLTGAPVLALFVAFFSTGLGSYFTERRRAGAIRTAFSKYVSSEVVEEMIAHPEYLKLGGHRREISVLFSDLAGFTSISEKLSADDVATLINLYLNAMTRIIMAHGGTVDKFIGDAVMAFWGAPLDDSEHARHAVQSAIAMQDAMRDLQPQFQALGVPEVKLRIGINSGPAIVGNMGSDLRFDYTAIGDTVNLASRLEGANKSYGTGIMLAGGTAELVGAEISLRRVDRVRVKGKDVPVDVFVPCNEPELIAATERAWEAYLAQDWGRARECWQAVAAEFADDRLAPVFLQKIASHEASPPAPDWDGSVALEKL